jgi:hypothetical protein
VMDDGLGGGGQYGLRHRRRARGEKVILLDHEASLMMRDDFAAFPLILYPEVNLNRFKTRLSNALDAT